MKLCNYSVGLLTVRKLRLEGKNPIGTADLEWIFARNCEGTESLRNFVKMAAGDGCLIEEIDRKCYEPKNHYDRRN